MRAPGAVAAWLAAIVESGDCRRAAHPVVPAKAAAHGACLHPRRSRLVAGPWSAAPRSRRSGEARNPFGVCPGRAVAQSRRKIEMDSGVRRNGGERAPRKRGGHRKTPAIGSLTFSSAA